MTDHLRIGPGFAKWLDVMAAVRPKVIRLYLWFFGVMSIWASIGLVSSVAASDWGVATVFVVGVVFSGLAWLRLLRAKRRIPETLRSLRHLPGP